METITKAATAKVGDKVVVVVGNVWDYSGAKIVEAYVVAETEGPVVGRQVMCANADGFMYMVTELTHHEGFHYCTSGFNWDERWHGKIGNEANVTRAVVKDWAERDYSELNAIKGIKSEEDLDKYMEMVSGFNKPHATPEGVDYDIGEIDSSKLDDSRPEGFASDMKK